MTTAIGNKVIKAKVSHCLGSVSNGNTNETRHSLSRNRARCWCFTLNNYSEEDIVSLSHNKWEDLEISKYAFQEEIGREKKTPHLQGTVQFKWQISFTTLKEFHNKISWRKCKNLRASIKYCTKEDTRKAGTSPYTYNIPDNWLWKDRNEIILMTYTEIMANMREQMKQVSLDLGDLKLCIGKPGNGGRY